MLTDNTKQIIQTADGKMMDAVKFLEESLKNYRVGKANPQVFNKVLVNYYGTPTPVPQVGSVTAPDARTLAIQPWERSLIPAIEKAIIDANIGLTPSNNGETIRCTVPALTEERRKELCKNAKSEGENAKIVIRNARRDAVDAFKKAVKNDGISEDVQKEGEEEVQKLTDKRIKEVDELVSAKEKDILAV